MLKIIRKFSQFFTASNTNSERKPSIVRDTGFHGDSYLLNLVDKLAANTTVFIETGTNVGTTVHYMASTYPHLQIYSCEPHKETFEIAKETTRHDSSVHLYNQLSPDFLYDLHDNNPDLLESLNFYWLDAHSYGYRWPLHDEIRYITSKLPQAIILIDDAQVPEQEDVFTYSLFEDQICNQDYVVNALAPDKTYHIFYPTYSEHTSKHHPLIGTIGILHGDVKLNNAVFDNFKVIEVTT